MRGREPYLVGVFSGHWLFLTVCGTDPPGMHSALRLSASALGTDSGAHTHTRTYARTRAHPPLQRQDRKAYVTSLCSFRSFLSPGQPFNTDSSILAGICWREVVFVEVRLGTDSTIAWKRAAHHLERDSETKECLPSLSLPVSPPLILNLCWGWVQAKMLRGDWTERAHHD